MGYLNANYKAHLPIRKKICLSCVLWFMLLHNLPVFSRYPEAEELLHLGVARLPFELIERELFHLKMQGFFKDALGNQ